MTAFQGSESSCPASTRKLFRVDFLLRLRRIPRAAHCLLIDQRLYSGSGFGRESHACCAEIFFQMHDARRADDRHDVRPLVQEPRDRHSSGCRADFDRNGAKLREQARLLSKIKPSVAATTCDGERRGSNAEFVDSVARTNVQERVKTIRPRSAVLAKLESEEKIRLIGSMHRLDGASWSFSRSDDGACSCASMR